MTHTPPNMHSIIIHTAFQGWHLHSNHGSPFCIIIRLSVASEFPSGMSLVPGDGSNVSIFDAAFRSPCLHANSYYGIIILTNTCVHLGACMCASMLTCVGKLRR